MIHVTFGARSGPDGRPVWSRIEAPVLDDGCRAGPTTAGTTTPIRKLGGSALAGSPEFPLCRRGESSHRTRRSRARAPDSMLPRGGAEAVRRGADG